MPFKSAEAVPIMISAVSASMLAVAALSAPPMHAGPIDAPGYVTMPVEVDMSSALPLDRIRNAAVTLSGATVESSKGDEIGRVQSVKLDADGTPVEVGVAATGLFGVGTLTRSIDARDLLYVKNRNALVSRLTSAELRTPPAPAKH